MSLPMKLGIGGLGLSAIIIPGAWMVATAEPSSVSLASLSYKEYEGKFGEDFKHHLVDAKEGKNQSWWDWSFRYRWQADKNEGKGGNFEGVSDGSSLRAKCEDIYKKNNKEHLHKEENLEDERKAWRYCSLEGAKPITLSESDYDKETSQQETIKKTKLKELISTIDPRNSKFWEIQGRAFLQSSDGLGSKAEGTDSSIFKKLYKGAFEGTLRDVCLESYNKTSPDESDRKNTLLFCSLLVKES